MDQIRRETVIVDIEGEKIAQEVYVDEQSRLDIDPNTGVFRPRAETEQLIRDVYNVGKVSLRSELERYNKWVRTADGRKQQENLFRKVNTTVFSGASDHHRSTIGTTKQTSPEQAMEAAEGMKTKGNESLSRNDARKALQCYNTAITLLNSQDAVAGWRSSSKVLSALAVYNSNASEACLRLERNTMALRFATDALALDPMREKSWFRECTALFRLGKLPECRNQIAAARSNGRNLTSLEWTLLEKHVEAAPRVRVDVSSGSFVTCADVTKGEVLAELPCIAVPAELVMDSEEVSENQKLERWCRWFFSEDAAMARAAFASYLALCHGPPLVPLSPQLVELTVKALASTETLCVVNAADFLCFLLCAGLLNHIVMDERVACAWVEGLTKVSDEAGSEKWLLVLGKARLRLSGRAAQESTTAQFSFSDGILKVVSRDDLTKGTVVTAL